MRWCIVGNFGVLLMYFVPVILYQQNGTYFRFGWHSDLVVVSVPIDTLERYIGCLVIITAARIMEVIVQEIAHPILGFSIYNPDKKVITDFSKNELQIYANLMYLVEGFKYIFKIIINITQFDLALVGMVVGEITSVYTIRMLLNAKRFEPDGKGRPREPLLPLVHPNRWN